VVQDAVAGYRLIKLVAAMPRAEPRIGTLAVCVSMCSNSMGRLDRMPFSDPYPQSHRPQKRAGRPANILPVRPGTNELAGDCRNVHPGKKTGLNRKRMLMPLSAV
jgi:hypothetical protein